MAVVTYSTAGVPGARILSALGFLTAYAIVNFVLLNYLEWVGSGRARMGSVVSGLGVGLGSLLLYGIVATAVVTLVQAGATLVIPLTLVPIWALRTALEYRARMLDHYYETVAALTQMLQRAHPYTHGHVERVGRAAEEVGLRLGLPAGRARLLREAAVLHDIGKIAVDEEILDKPCRLTPQEMDHVREHAAAGARILEPVEQFAPLVPWIRHHHERPDGLGYPSGLRQDEIPLESRIIAVIDAFDAMTGGDGPGQARPYKQPLSHHAAIAELERNSGTQFDRAVVEVFREVVKGGLD
jgi:HD-GYP domain-containing protein (c-di-GMP phosphodiesterase class II)